MLRKGCLCCIFGYEKGIILILLIMPCCCNVFINWVFAVPKFSDSPQWSCPVSQMQSLLLRLGTCFRGNSPRECPRIPYFWFMWMIIFIYAFTNTEWVTFAVCWRYLSNLLWWWFGFLLSLSTLPLQCHLFSWKVLL